MSQATDPLGQAWQLEAASPRRITVLGSTGSIGRQTLEVAAWRGYQVVGLVAGRDGATLLEQVLRWRPAMVSCLPEAAEALRPHLPAGTRLLSGEAGACEVAAAEADVVVAAIPGFQGLAPTRAAIRAGRTVALANKEAMVCAGTLVWQEARASGARITPVDSEHAALFQSLLGEPKEGIDRLVLTASGGPFRLGPADLSLVTPQQAMAHPNWSMGPKVTVDSATLFNKGLEVLEAAYLFELPVERIEVVVHPQSLVHGLVRFKDGSLKAQIGPHDMRLPIQYAIEAPNRPAVPLQPLPLAGEWSFHPPDTERFPALALAFEAGRMGGEAPLRLNAADEVAVEAFLAGRLRFSDIPTVLATALSTAGSRSPGWDELAAVDDEARRLAAEALDTMAVRA